jgi:hypothetical protein
VGLLDDYVYVDGCEVLDRSGKPNPIGQMLITIGGDVAAKVCGKKCANTSQHDLVLADDAEVVRAARSALAGVPKLAIAMSCVTRLRESHTTDPTIEERQLHTLIETSDGGKHAPNVPLFGAFCGGELGLDLEGHPSDGGDRLMLALLSDR